MQEPVPAFLGMPPFSFSRNLEHILNIQKTPHPFEVPANEAERLVSVRSLLPSDLTISDELNILTTLVQDVFHAASCSVTIIDEDWQRIAATSGIKAADCPREKSGCTHVVFSGQPLIVPDMRLHPAFRQQDYVTGEPGFRFYAGFPLAIDEGLTLGALCVIDTKPRDFDSHQCAEMRSFAQLASALLSLQRKNTMLQSDKVTLRKNALTDPLTQLYNRRALKEHVAPFLRQHTESKQSAGILLLDMDNFKTINDTYGHPAGDRLLKQAADRIRSVLGADDIPVRIGGDEFCVILPAVQNDTDLQIIADRMVEAFRMPFKISGHDVYSAASIGTLLTPEDGTTSEQLSRHADKALYMAKARGRNCAVRFDKSML
ncbi:diguanylate cyclase (GGDEF)-like protein [Pseudochrobactrum asaccharolyticum]|uniref:Diguanylate cyclase (GGDEF)-like protein n=1 Tax=Pseudochrobactrum asaccharolyticum TaxID=354351 RepID=A0A366DTN3_9HYPH|nr:diguanylate cyclase (GGDEF)-like protein [Pseudochrobactrum asaccharolyticum]